MRPLRPSPNHIWITTFAEYDADGTLLHEEGYWYEGPIAQASVMNHGLVQDHFRVRTDTNTPDGGTPTWAAAEDTDVSLDVDTTFRVRFVVSCTGGTNFNDDLRLYYALDTGGGFGSFAAADSSTTPVQFDTAASTVDAATGFGVASANFLLTAGTGTVTDGAYDEAQPITDTAGSNVVIQDGRYTEIEVGLSLDSANINNGDKVQLRLYDGNGGSPTAFTAEAGSYTNTPTITAIAASAPVISSPTASATGPNTGTGGFSTDTTSGTGYYYISTSATPPSATDLKAGTGAVDSGNSTITASPHTFNFSGLSASTSYYAHYIQNTTGGDSNIVSSAQFTTNAIVTGDSTLSANLSETITNLLTGLSDTSLSTNLSETLTNLLTGYSDATLTSNLSEAINNVLIASKSASFGLQLSTSQVASIVVSGSMTLGVNFAKTTSSVASRVAAFNADITVSKSSIATKLLSAAATYSLTLDYDVDTLGIGILDDPVWSISSDEYIFVDLTNIALTEGTIKSGTLTLTTNMGHTTTVQLVGEAATDILLNLSQVQSATADRTASAVLSKQLSKTSSAVANIFRTVAFAIDLDKLSDADIAKLASLILALDLSMTNTNVMSADKSVTFTQNLSETISALKDVPGDLTLSADLSQENLNSLIKPLTVDFDITLDLLEDLQADLNAAITYLMNLSETIEGTTQGVKYGTTTFTTNLAKTTQLQAVLNPIISFIANVSDTNVATKICSEAITYLLQLQETITANKNVLGALSLVLNVSDEEIAQSGIFAFVDYIVNLSESVNVKADYVETLTLLINLSQVSTSLKSVSGLTNLDINLSTSQLNQLYKILTVAFISNLSTTPTNKADLNTTINLAATLSEFLIAETTGNLQAFATFAANVSHESLNLKQTFEAVTFQALLDELSTGSRSFLATAQLDLTLDDASTVNLTRDGIVSFNTIFTELAGNTMVGRPTMSIDMTLADLSSTQKQTLAQILLGMQAQTSYIGAKEVAGLVLYGLNNGLDTSVSLTAEGQVTFTTQLIQTGIPQLLGQAGITFGQLVGLASLGSALRDANIDVGIITDVSTSGFVIQFSLVTPEGRILKVYLEDRITIVDEENRVIKIWDRPGITVN